MTLSSLRDHSAILLAAAFLAACSHPPAPATLRIAAAADLRFALDHLSREFHTAHPAIDTAITYGSSGNFYSQIRNGAPFDLFLSADIDYPRRLIAEKFAAADSLFEYGSGRIVLWVPAASPLDPASLQFRTLEADSVQHIAIGNPQHAPYGRAAVAAMRSAGVYDRVSAKLVLGENIAQAFEFVQSGAAQAGIVAISFAVAPTARGQGKYWEIPLDAYPTIQQGGAILSHSAHVSAAADFRRFLLSPAGRRVLKQYGFYSE